MDVFLWFSFSICTNRVHSPGNAVTTDGLLVWGGSDRYAWFGWGMSGIKLDPMQQPSALPFRSWCPAAAAVLGSAVQLYIRLFLCSCSTSRSMLGGNAYALAYLARGIVSKVCCHQRNMDLLLLYAVWCSVIGWLMGLVVDDKQPSWFQDGLNMTVTLLCSYPARQGWVSRHCHHWVLDISQQL